MGNCLVTKLKGTVDNNNLPKLGEGVVRVNYSAERTSFSLYPKASLAIRVSDGLHIEDEAGKNYGQVAPVNYEGTSLYVSAGEGYLFFDKYNVTYTFLANDRYTIDINEFKFKSNNSALTLSSISGRNPNAYGDITDFEGRAQQLDIFGASVTGSLKKFLLANKDILLGTDICSGVNVDCEDLSQCTKLTRFFTEGINTGNIKGDFNSLGKTALNNIYIQEATNALHGSIEGFVAERLKVNKAAGTLKIGYTILHGVTYQGVPVNTVGYGNWQFTWDAEGNITKSAV